MKRRFLWISMLLAITMLFCSCSEFFLKQRNNGATTDQNSTTETPTAIYGMWYCADAYTVVELKEGNVFDYYTLVSDSYAYAVDIFTASYTVSGTTVTLPLEEDFSLVIHYDSTKDVFAVDGLEMSFTRVDLLPSKLETADPQKFKGIWYCKDMQRVYDFREDGTLTAYSIQAGYYTYSASETATYTVSDAFIEIRFEGSETPTSLIYNNGKDSLTNGYGYSFARVNELPPAHPVVEYPNYSEIDFSAITLGNYKGRDLTTNATAYAALDIFTAYYKANTDKKPTAITEDRTSKYGDRVVIDYTGYLDGVAFSGGAATNVELSIVENSGYIPGFAEGIAGHKMGETFDVNVTFPANYGSTALAGKSVVFTMTLHTIYDTSLSDEAIKTYSKDAYATYADMLKEYVAYYRAQEIWSLLKKEATYTSLPLESYNYFYCYYRDYYHSYAFSYGIDYDTFLQKYVGLTDADLLVESQTVALSYIIPQIIYKAEGIAWNEEVYNTLLDQYVKDAMEYFKYSEEEAKTFVLENEANNLNATVIQEIVSDWLLEQNN